MRRAQEPKYINYYSRIYREMQEGVEFDTAVAAQFDSTLHTEPVVFSKNDVSRCRKNRGVLKIQSST